MTDGEGGAAVGAAERISRELAAIHEQSYGEPPLAVQTHILGDAVVCILDVDLLPHERILLENDVGTKSIRAVRSDFQTSIASTFVATVEHSTGRRVTGFLSNIHLDPSFTVEFFRLAPEA